MNSFWEWVDTFGGPVLLFALAYGIFIVGVLWAWRRNRHQEEVCERCGGRWKFNSNGFSYHLCQPRRDRAYP